MALGRSLSHDVDSAKRVVFNAITEREIREVFEQPRAIMDRVAQQARRILDRTLPSFPIALEADHQWTLGRSGAIGRGAFGGRT